MWDSNILLGNESIINLITKEDMYIDKLESYILKCNKGLSKGKELVSNSVYTALMDYLYTINPNSPMLKESWNNIDGDELDKHLKNTPILSKRVVNSLKDKSVKVFKSKLYNYPIDVICSVKLVGQPIRVVYKNGVIHKAITRCKSGVLKDVTSQAITILGKKNNSLKGRGVVELRGDIVLNVENLSKAKTYDSNIKNIYTAVANLLKDDVSEEGIKLLDIVFNDILGDMFMFDTLTDKYQFIERSGFATPLAFIDSVEKYSFEDDLLRILGKSAVYIESYNYALEGLIVTIDDIDLYNSFGVSNGYINSSILLKIGQFKGLVYSSNIKDIKWVDKMGTKLPMAILEDEVTVGNSKVISSVPLYSPCYILMLNAYRGSKLHFKYIGDFGVIPTTVDGEFIVSIE